MKKQLKLLNIIIIVLLLLTCSSCQQVVGENQFRLPNLANMTREQIDETLSQYDLKYVYYFEQKIIKSELEYDQFVRYGNGKKSGDVLDNGSFIRIYTTPLRLTYKRSDEVKIDFEWEGKSFVNDGVGKVTLVNPTDGDTARFKDSITGEVIRVRFLGIDTPESTIQLDPWGKEASNYAAKRLKEAKEIILESEGPRTETYGRYLAWVWLDGKLYNLQVLEEAYTNSTCSSSSKYYEYMSDVDIHVSKTGRRFFGEIDPNYNYD